MSVGGPVVAAVAGAGFRSISGSVLVRVLVAVVGGLLAGFLGGLLRGRRPSAPGAGYVTPTPAADATAVGPHERPHQRPPAPG